MLKKGFVEEPGINRLFSPPCTVNSSALLFRTPLGANPPDSQGGRRAPAELGGCSSAAASGHKPMGKLGWKRGPRLRQTDAGGWRWAGSKGRGGHSSPLPTDPRGG